VTQTAKPGSPLTTSFAYDPLYNKTTSVTGPHGLVTTMRYDALTGNPARVVADAGGAGAFWVLIWKESKNGLGDRNAASDLLEIRC
jgi:hypothetical protein